MDSSLEKLKQRAAELQSQRTHSRTPYPSSFWDEVVEAAREFPVTFLAKQLNLSGPNLTRQIHSRRKQKKTTQKFVEVPQASLPVASPKQLLITLPNGTSLRFDL